MTPALPESRALVIAGTPVDVLEVKADALPALAQQITVTDEASAQLAGRFLVHLANRRRERVAHHAEVKRKADEAHKAACAAERADLKPLDDARNIVGPRVIAWDDEQKRLRLLQEAESRRIAEAQAKAEQQQAALEAIDAGASVEEVEAIVTAPVFVAPVVAPPAAKVKGISTRETWKGRITSKQVLIEFVAKNPSLNFLIDVNESQLNRMANAQRSTFNIPGAEAYPVVGVGVRTK